MVIVRVCGCVVIVVVASIVVIVGGGGGQWEGRESERQRGRR